MRDPSYEIEPIRATCPECAYDLRSLVTLSGARCPECGADLGFDRLAFRATPAAWRDRLDPLLLAAPAFLALIGRLAVEGPDAAVWRRSIVGVIVLVAWFRLLRTLWPAQPAHRHVAWLGFTMPIVCFGPRSVSISFALVVTVLAIPVAVSRWRRARPDALGRPMAIEAPVAILTRWLR